MLFSRQHVKFNNFADANWHWCSATTSAKYRLIGGLLRLITPFGQRIFGNNRQTWQQKQTSIHTYGELKGIICSPGTNMEFSIIACKWDWKTIYYPAHAEKNICLL